MANAKLGARTRVHLSKCKFWPESCGDDDVWDEEADEDAAEEDE